MTDIGGWTWDSYLKLPKIIVIDDQFKPHTFTSMRMGVYDPDWGVYDESYAPGKFVNEIGEPYVDDKVYNETTGMVLTFKHSWFGNTWAKNIGNSHFHVHHIVSTNTIRPQDVKWETENGDIMFFANIARNPPHAITQANGTEEVLIELEPFLSPDDLAKLAKDGKFVHKLKEKFMAMESKVFKLDSDLFVKTSEAASAQITCMDLQQTVNGLFQNERLIMDKVLKLKLETNSTILNGIELLEAEHNFGFPMGQVHFEDMGKTAAMLQDNIRMLNVKMKLNGEEMSETQAWILFNQCMSVIGIERARRFIGGIEQHNVFSPMGAQRVTMSKNPSFTEMMMLKSQQLENGQISTADFNTALNDYMQSQNRTIQNNPSINGAVEEMKAKLLGAPQQEVHAGGNGTGR